MSRDEPKKTRRIIGLGVAALALIVSTLVSVSDGVGTRRAIAGFEDQQGRFDSLTTELEYHRIGNHRRETRTTRDSEVISRLAAAVSTTDSNETGKRAKTYDVKATLEFRLGADTWIFALYWDVGDLTTAVELEEPQSLWDGLLDEPLDKVLSLDLDGP